ncbi:DHH family phosphoesterase [Youngiibacter fragilis]|uniref:Cyclic-di-AMP phosphodiesterase n=1 Tax=Youngiibacter fragilis 232.1 TaxID=994573 RepID=V7I7U0_9CLOT|nr:DHH family phosphoesterase [Youngiibacter fragilis]ETA81304.1 delta-lactam-biosynthetic de-N-acetylase [Youngiibacter fragilis 232.1]
MDKYYKFKKSDLLYAAIIAASLGALSYYGHHKEATVLFILSIAALVYLDSLYIYKRKKWDRFVDTTIKKMYISVYRSAENADFPIILVGRDGDIIWNNKSARNAFGWEEIESGFEILTGKKAEELFMENGPSSIDIEIKDKVYHINNVYIRSSEGEFNEEMALLTFIDITDIRDAEAKSVSVMLLEIDNFSDLMQSIENDKKPFLLAELEKVIFGYGQNTMALVKRYDSSKYMLIIPNKYLDEEIRKKFNILDKIKEIDQGNTIEPTISIGVGMDGQNPRENSQLANAAKELALGRGGDQAVVKTKENLQFFGGKSKEIEKKSRVRSRVVAHALRDLISESGSIFIMGHKNPDMDCLGAAIGINVIARGLGKDARILLEEPYSNILPLLNKFRSTENYKDTFVSVNQASRTIRGDDLLIIVDVHSENYVLDKEFIDNFSKRVIVDHHRRAPDQIQGSTMSYIENYASSTSELVTELIQYIFEKPNLSILEAESLFAGIRVDTKSFNFKTGVRTFEAASFLKRLGASSQDIRELFASDLESYVRKSELIKKAVIEDNIAITTYDGDDADLLLAAQAADELVGFKNINASFVLARDNADVVISGRSMGIQNVQVILEALGGGGHMTMAGARLKGVTMEEALQRLKDAISENKKEEE